MNRSQCFISRRRRGYLLFVVVVMIAVASITLSQFASVTMQVASDAVSQEKSVRERWAVTSMRRTCLRLAPEILDAEPRESSQLFPTAWRDIRLAEKNWRVIVADESAKLNVQRLCSEVGPQRCANAIDQLLTGNTGGVASAISRHADSKQSKRWEAWLKIDGPNEFLTAERMAESTQRVSLWGDGMLNISKCDAETLDVLWKALFGRKAPDVIHDRRLEWVQHANAPITSLFAIRESQANVVARWVTNQSTCYSMWILHTTEGTSSRSFFVEWGGERRANRRGFEY